MSDQPVRELRALLFGEDPYDRVGAPEPEMLVAIFPVLPESLVEEALTIMHYVGMIGENERFLALIKMLEDSPETGQDEILAELITQNPALLHHLPSSLLARTRAALSQYEAWDDAARDKALTKIAQRLGEEPEQDDLAQRARGLDLPNLSPWDVAELAQCLPILSEAQLTAAWQRVKEFWDWDPGAIVLLAPLLPEALLSQAVELTRSEVADYAPERPRAKVLISLAPYLPPHLAREAVGIAQTLEDLWWQTRSLAALLPHLPEEDRPSEQEQATVASRAAAMTDERIRQLWRQLPKAQQTMLAREVIDRVEDQYAGAPPPEPGPPAEAPAAETDDLAGCIGPSPLVTLLEKMAGGLRPRRGDGPLPPDPSPWTRDAEEARPPQERIINTGFAEEAEPGRPIDKAIPLVRGRKHYFWFEVGSRIAGAIDVQDVELSVDLPEGARLHIALFAFEGELGITRGADVGELEIQLGGSVRVLRRVAEPQYLRNGELLDRRLFFPVTTPDRTGTFRLRCNIYHKQVLLHSLVIYAQVSSLSQRLTRRVARPFVRWRRGGGAAALWTEPVPDFSLSNTLRPQALAPLREHALSIMLNDNGDGTHSFRFFGKDGAEPATRDAPFDSLEVDDLITIAREAFREVAWDSEDEWDENRDYQYEDPPDLEQLQEDLSYLALRGMRMYGMIIGRLAQAQSEDAARLHDERAWLERITLPPGYIQVATTEHHRLVIPVALLYDYLLDDVPTRPYELCPEFLSALEDGRDLASTECFQGRCPTREQAIRERDTNHGLVTNTVVCPSGFWGYRHRIGMPFSIGYQGDDAAMEIAYEDSPEITLVVATDPDLELVGEHERDLRALAEDATWRRASTRLDTLRLMADGTSHLVYFYCHGGLATDNTPYLALSDSELISTNTLRQSNILWQSPKPRPLVFLNGCRTTAVTPRHAYDLLTRFAHMNAAGVIGTEITIFESLAVSFANACLGHFLEGIPIGEAVRLARLKLLEERNPLGLVYDPFVVASLAMTERA